MDLAQTQEQVQQWVTALIASGSPTLVIGIVIAILSQMLDLAKRVLIIGIVVAVIGFALTAFGVTLWNPFSLGS